jgi:hypothetical protein
MSDPLPGAELASSLHAFACRAAELAGGILAAGQPRAGAHAASWMRATREALEAAQIADAPIANGERAAIAAQITALRRQVCTVEERRAELERQRDDLAELVSTVIATLDADTDAHGHRSAGYAAQVRRDLAAISPAALDRQEANETRTEAT